MGKNKLWLGRDCEIELEEAKKRVYLINPEKVAISTSSAIWRRLTCAFGKCEFETWFAHELHDAAVKAVASKDDYAELTKFTNASLFIASVDGKKMQRTMSSEGFLKRVVNLPIFRKLMESEDEVILEFIPA